MSATQVQPPLMPVPVRSEESMLLTAAQRRLACAAPVLGDSATGQYPCYVVCIVLTSAQFPIYRGVERFSSRFRIKMEGLRGDVDIP